MPKTEYNETVLVISSSYKHASEEDVPDKYIECMSVDIIGDSIRYVVWDCQLCKPITHATRKWQSVKWYHK
jgi:hypothetical protein